MWQVLELATKVQRLAEPTRTGTSTQKPVCGITCK